MSRRTGAICPGWWRRAIAISPRTTYDPVFSPLFIHSVCVIHLFQFVCFTPSRMNSLLFAEFSKLRTTSTTFSSFSTKNNTVHLTFLRELARISAGEIKYTNLFCRLGDKRVAILYAEVGSRLSGEEAELSVLGFTGCVRDAPQRVRHLHALEKIKSIIVHSLHTYAVILSEYVHAILQRWNISFQVCTCTFSQFRKKRKLRTRRTNFKEKSQRYRRWK